MHGKFKKWHRQTLAQTYSANPIRRCYGVVRQLFSQFKPCPTVADPQALATFKNFCKTEYATPAIFCVPRFSGHFTFKPRSSCVLPAELDNVRFQRHAAN